VKKLALSLLAALLALAAVAGPAAAKPRPPKPPKSPPGAKFIATFEGERTIDYDIPRFEYPAGCGAVNYTYGNGHESWKVQAKPFKVHAVGSGSVATLRFGTWNPREAAPDVGLPASGFRERRSDVFRGGSGGWCGTSWTSLPAATDCGTRIPKHTVVFTVAGQKATAEVIDAPDNQALGFGQCALFHSPKIDDGAWGRATAKVKPGTKDARIFGHGKQLTYRFHESYPDTGTVAPGGAVSENAVMDWTLTLTRVK
jgi:hypothetical protein